MLILSFFFFFLFFSFFIKNSVVRNFWPIFAIFSLIFITAFLSIPFSEHFNNESEINLPYVKYISQDIIPGIHNSDWNNFSLVFVFGHFFHKYLGGDARIFIYLFRIFFFIALVFSFFNLALVLSRKYIFSIDEQNIFVLSSLILFVFDWNNSYLLIGDEFKSFCAEVFYLIFLTSLIEKKIKKSVLYFFLTLLGHWAFVLLLGLNAVLFITARYVNLNKFVVLITPALGLLMAYCYKESFNFISPYHYWYLNTYNIKKGLLDGFFLRPGVLLATLIYFSGIAIVIKNVVTANNNFFMKFCTFNFLILFSFSKYGVVFKSGFIEPARNYIMLSPYFSLLIAFLSCRYQLKNILLILLGFISINFIFRNFSQGSIPFWDIILKDDLRIFIDYTFHTGNQVILLFASFILIFYLIFLCIKHKNRRELVLL